MNVKELMEILQGLPADMEVMVPAESNVDRVVSVYVAKVAKTKRDWSNTPVGNFHVFDDYDLGLRREETTGDPFAAVIIDQNGTRTRLEERIPVGVFDFIEQCARETAAPPDAAGGG